MTTKNNLTWPQVREVLPKSFHCIYADYRDHLEENPKLCQEIVSSNMWEDQPHWFEGYDFTDDINLCLNEMSKHFDEDSISIWMADEENRDHLRTYIEEHDDSNPDETYLSQTNLTMFYETGYEMQPDFWRWAQEKELNREIQRVKKALKLPASYDKNDEIISEMIQCATYGGYLVIYFRAKLNELINWQNEDSDFSKIIFEGNCSVAIIDTYGGSGHDGVITLPKTSFAFHRDRLKVCKAIKNSYSYEVCGMVENWCDNTKFELNYDKRGIRKKAVEKSEISKIEEQNREYDKIYKAGSCSRLDIDITRHRKVTYINQFPCGNKCLDCGAFWID